MTAAPMRILLPCIAVLMSFAGNAGADTLFLSIQEDNGPVTVLSTTGTTINAMGSYSGVTDFSFASGFSATATLGSTQGKLNGTGTIESTSSAHHTLTIKISEGAYTQPAGPNYVMGSSSSYTDIFLSNSSTDTLSFQSFATAGSVQFGTGVASPGFTYNPLQNLGVGQPGGGSDNEANTNFAAPSGYTLTEIYVWNSYGANDSLNPTGSTIVSAAVPEPSSLILLTLGSVGIVVTRLRRRRRA
jgi:PEP-CTERM motif